MVRYIITSPLSLARVLWWYGEDSLWPRALELDPRVVADLAEEFAHLMNHPEQTARLWPSAPRDAYLLLPTIGSLEGRPRPAGRRHRRPASLMPEVLAVEEEQRWEDPQLLLVARMVDVRSGTASPGPPPAQRPRLRGRWASW